MCVPNKLRAWQILSLLCMLQLGPGRNLESFFILASWLSEPTGLHYRSHARFERLLRTKVQTTICQLYSVEPDCGFMIFLVIVSVVVQGHDRVLGGQ